MGTKNKFGFFNYHGSLVYRSADGTFIVNGVICKDMQEVDGHLEKCRMILSESIKRGMIAQGFVPGEIPAN